MKKLAIIAAIIVLSWSCNRAFAFRTNNKHKATTASFSNGVKMTFTIGDRSFAMISYYMNFMAPNKAITSHNELNVVIKTTEVDQDSYNWFLNLQPSEKDGSINIYDTDSGKLLRTIKFTGLKMSTFNESNSNIYSQGLQTTLWLRFKSAEITLAKN